MKEKILVFGFGRDFEKNKEIIKEVFNVVGCTDNFAHPMEDFWKKRYVEPSLLLNVSFDKILICSSVYRGAITVQLMKWGVPFEKIIGIEVLEGFGRKHEFEEVLEDMKIYKERNTDERFLVSEQSLYLISQDKHKDAGTPCEHYFAQDIWGSRKIYQNKPQRHYDIGSRLDGFIAHLLVFREVFYIDIRPLPYEIPGLHFIRANATDLSNLQDNSLESLSCFHALEHFGLGRYGDDVDPDAYKKAAESMKRVLAKNGHLYIGVPVGPIDKLMFNAHRIFSIHTVLSLFEGLILKDIAIIDPKGVSTKSISNKDYLKIEECSCGLFEFIK